MNLRTLFFCLLFFASSYGMFPVPPFEAFLQELEEIRNSPSPREALKELEGERMETLAALCAQRNAAESMLTNFGKGDPSERRMLLERIKELEKLIKVHARAGEVIRQEFLICPAAGFSEAPPIDAVRPQPTRSSHYRSPSINK